MVDIAEVRILIKGDASSLQNASNQAKSGLSDLSSGLKGIGTAGMAVGAALTAGITVPLTAIAAFAMKASSDVGGAFRVIQQQTGATGATLTSLKQTFTDVFNSVPVDANQAAQSIALLHQQLGLLGPDLTNLETTLANLSRITGTDLTTDTKAAADAFQAWHVATGDQISTLNDLYRVSVVAPIPIDTLLGLLQQYAPALQAFNMPLEQSALLIGNLTHAGIDVQPVLNGIRTWMSKVAMEENKANAALDGTAKGAAKASDILSVIPTNFTDLYNSIKNATSSQAAYNSAVEAFGSRSAPVMVKAIRDGTLNLSQFQALVNSNTTDINTMAAQTITLSQAFTLFKQKAELAFAPLGQAISTAMLGAVNSLTPLTTVAQAAGAAFNALPAPVKTLIVLFGGLLAAVGPTVLSFGGMISAIAQFSSIIGGAIAGSGLLASALGIILPALIILAIPIAILVTSIGLLAAGFVVAYQTSSTLQQVIANLSRFFGDLIPHLQTAFGLFTSGNWKGGIDELTVGFSDLARNLSIIDWNKTGQQIVDQITTGIATHKSAFLTAFNGWASDAAAWISHQNWDSIGEQVGTLIAGGVHVALTGSTAGLKALLGELAGPTPAQQQSTLQSSMMAVGTGGAKQVTGGAGGLSDLETAGGAAVGSFITGFKAGLAKEPWSDDIKAAIKVAGPVSVDIIADITVKWPLEGLGLGSVSPQSLLTPGGFTKDVILNIAILQLAPLMILYDVLKWIIGIFSVHDVGINVLLLGMWQQLLGLPGVLAGLGSKTIAITLTLLGDARTMITQAIGGAFGFTLQLLSDARNLIVGSIGGAFGFFLQLLSDARGMIAGAIGGAFGFFVQLLSDVRGMIAGAIGGAFGIAVGIANDIRGAIQGAIGGAFDATVNVFAHLLGGGGVVGWAESKLAGWGLAPGPKPVHGVVTYPGSIRIYERSIQSITLPEDRFIRALQGLSLLAACRWQFMAKPDVKHAFLKHTGACLGTMS